MFNDLIKENPEDGSYYYNRAIVREMLRDEMGACDDWNKALSLGIKEAQNHIENCK